MNAFLNHHNGISVTGIIGVTANSISLFQENEPPKNINGISIPNSDISIAEPYDVQIDVLGNYVVTMHQFIAYINDTEFVSFYTRIDKQVFFKNISTYNLGLHINSMLYYFCKSIK